jgi:hypothetical protein
MPLRRDFFGDYQLTYRPLEAAQARKLVTFGVGGYDGRLLSDLLTSRRTDLHLVSVDDDLGRADDAKPAVVSACRRVKVLAERMASHRGHWLTWRTYERAAGAAARVQASELRTGKVAATRHSRGRVRLRSCQLARR